MTKTRFRVNEHMISTGGGAAWKINLEVNLTEAVEFLWGDKFQLLVAGCHFLIFYALMVAEQHHILPFTQYLPLTLQ
jgi:hypothetical protein